MTALLPAAVFGLTLGFSLVATAYAFARIEWLCSRDRADQDALDFADQTNLVRADFRPTRWPMPHDGCSVMSLLSQHDIDVENARIQRYRDAQCESEYEYPEPLITQTHMRLSPLLVGAAVTLPMWIFLAVLALR